MTKRVVKSCAFQACSHQQQQQQQRHNAMPAMGSSSLGLTDMLPSNGLQGCRKARQQGVLFGASAFQPLPDIKQADAAAASSSLLTHQSRSAQSISLDSFQLPDRSTVHSQQLPFASLSSAHRPPKRKRKLTSIASDVAAAPAVHTRSKPGLVMLLAQNSARALESEADEQDLHDNARAKVAAAGQNLKQSALQLPRQLRRLLAGAFAGQIAQQLQLLAMLPAVFAFPAHQMLRHITSRQCPILHVAAILVVCGKMCYCTCLPPCNHWGQMHHALNQLILQSAPVLSLIHGLLMHRCIVQDHHCSYRDYTDAGHGQQGVGPANCMSWLYVCLYDI